MSMQTKIPTLMLLLASLAIAQEGTAVPDQDSLKTGGVTPTYELMDSTALPKLRVVENPTYELMDSLALPRLRTMDTLWSVFKAGEGVIISVPLDSLSIINGSFSIDLEGYVNLPVLGKFFVLDKSPFQVEQHLATNMAQHMKDTHVKATPAIRLTFLGNWERPGMYYVNPQSAVWEACKVAGGPGGDTYIRKWQVMRGSKLLDKSLLDDFSRGASLSEAGVKSGDIFIIPIADSQGKGSWYWFRESIHASAEVATVLIAGLTAYLYYLVLLQ